MALRKHETQTGSQVMVCAYALSATMIPRTMMVSQVRMLAAIEWEILSDISASTGTIHWWPSSTKECAKRYKRPIWRAVLF